MRSRFASAGLAPQVETAIKNGPNAPDRGHDEVAEGRHVDDVHEHRPRLGLLEDLHVQVGVLGGREDQEGAFEVVAAINI